MNCYQLIMYHNYYYHLYAIDIHNVYTSLVLEIIGP